MGCRTIIGTTRLYRLLFSEFSSLAIERSDAYNTIYGAIIVAEASCMQAVALAHGSLQMVFDRWSFYMRPELQIFRLTSANAAGSARLMYE